MQLVAYRENRSWILAHQASKGADYCCVECGGVVRKRGGIHRRDHFYHLMPTDRCRQNGKSMVHLQVQWAIQQALPPGEGQLEKKFQEIDRIADVFWEREKIVFEVQCSPISREELLARNRDYHSVGCDVVWILHDQRYNKRRVSAAEEALHKTLHYFTNIDIEGRGCIYDQLSLIKKGARVDNFTKFPIALSVPYREDAPCKKASPLFERLPPGRLYFSGDIRDRLLKGEIDEQRLIDFFSGEGAISSEWSILTFLQGGLEKGGLFYRKLFQWFLEKACR